MMSQLKGLGLVALVVVGILASSTYPARAADTCPALPNAGSTFGGALTNLINKATSGGSSGLSSAGDPVRQLNASQQQKVLGWLRTELDGKWAALAADRKKSEAEKKVEDLKRRIFTRDRMERNAAVVNNRIYDQVGGKVLPSARQGKPLGQIIDEEMARGNPSLANKYANKYKKAIFNAVKADPAKAGEFAGALSAGDYSTVMDMAADWGAAGFGVMVGDALGEMGYENSKAVWTQAVKHAGAAKQVMIALKDGKQDVAWQVIKDEWKKEVKNQSRAALKAAVNLAFNAGNGAGTIGDFVPNPGNVQNTLASDFFGLTPGDVYLKVLDAEVSFIDWSKDFLHRKWGSGDGACIRKYNEEYERLGNADKAYEEFDHCISTSKMTEMFKFTKQAKDLGVDPNVAVREYLEAQRRGLGNTDTPVEWMAAKLEAKLKAQERQMGPELMSVQQVMANIAKGVGPALNNRLIDFASAVLNEHQWNKLADEIRQLEQALDQTLAAVKNDLGRIRRYSDAIGKSCADYEQKKLIARRALNGWRNLDVSSSLWDRLIEIDTAACRQPEAMRRVDDNATKRALLGSSIKADQAKLTSAVENVCALPANIRNVASKAEARERLAAGLHSAGEIEAIAARLVGDAEKLAVLSKPSAGAANIRDGAASARKRVASKINALKVEIDALAGRFAELDGRFRPAHEAMRQALQRIESLKDPTQKIIERVQACLRPLAAAPVANHPRALLAELRQRNNDIGGCRGVVWDSWNERDLDPEPGPDGTRNAIAWRRRKLTLGHSIEQLRGKLAEIESQCPAAAATPPADTRATQQGLDPQAIKTAATDGRSRMQNCVAKARTTFDDTWGEPKIELSGATCSPQRNADIMTKLRQAAADGSPEAKKHIAKLAPVVAAVTRAHTRYEMAKHAYAAGDLSVVRSNLNDAKTTIDQLGGSPDCADLADKIARGLDKADRLDKALTDVGNALHSCNVAEIERVGRRYGNVKHAAIVAMLGRGNAIIAAIASYEEAKVTYSRGDLGSAQSNLTRARLTLSRAGGSVCPDLGKRIESGLGRIDRLSNVISAAELAAASCEASEVKRWSASLAKISNPAAISVKAKLKRCGANTAASRNAYCEKKYGRGSYAGNPDTTGKYYCIPSQTWADAWCNANKPGSGWKASKINFNSKGGFNCTKSSEQVRAEANAICRQKYGVGYYAGNPRGDGTYYCLPTKNAADAKCRKLNGPGAVAGMINADGSHGCHWSAAHRRQVWAACRRQFGRRLVNVRILRNGKYQCTYNTGTASGHHTRPSAADDAAAAAAVIGIIGGIAAGVVESSHGPRTGPRSSPGIRRTRSSHSIRRKCHYGLDRRIHCGRN